MKTFAFFHFYRESTVKTLPTFLSSLEITTRKGRDARERAVIITESSLRAREPPSISSSARYRSPPRSHPAMNNLTEKEPQSPDPPGWGIKYTPSKDSPSFVALHGRRYARILNGQDPEKNPEKFTPRFNPMYFEWPEWPSEEPKAKKPKGLLPELDKSKMTDESAPQLSITPQTSTKPAETATDGGAPEPESVPFKLP